jgi:hypothetical protein
MLDKHNDTFYSDQVDLKSASDTHHTMLTLLGSGKPVFLANYLTQLKLHTATLDKLVMDNPDVKDVRISLDNTTPPGLGTLRITGTKPWSVETISKFEEATKNEKTEVDQMNALIEKYPGKAASALGYLVEQAKLVGPELPKTETVSE